MAIVSSKDIKLYHPHRIMLVGNPTGGKTQLACTWPKPFVFDFDDGCRRIGGAGLDFDFEVFDVLHDPGAADAAKARVMEFKNSQRKHGYRTCVFDSLTAWSNAQMGSILRINRREKPQVQDYGMLADEMTSMLGRAIVSFDHVIVIAHEDLEKDEALGTFVAKPLCLGKKFVSGLPGYMEEMWFCESRAMGGKRKFSIKTLPDGRHPFLRTAIKDMPALMEDAT
jgi:hypothetical protein